MSEEIIAYEIVAILKDIKGFTGNYEEKLMTLTAEKILSLGIDTFAADSKHLQDYDALYIVVFYRTAKLMKLTHKPLAKSINAEILGNERPKSPTLYNWFFPKGTLIKWKLNTVHRGDKRG